MTAFFIGAFLGAAAVFILMKWQQIKADEQKVVNKAEDVVKDVEKDVK